MSEPLHAHPPSPEHLGDAFARLQQSLRSYLRRRLNGAAQADDLLQDIFVKALASQQAGRRVENLTGWLYAAARTTLADYYRSAGMPMEELDDDAPNPERDDIQLHAELSLCLKQFVEQLPPIYRDTLVAIEFRGETMRTVASSQKLSLSAIKTRAARARTMLREMLTACCHVEMAAGLVTDYHRISPTGCGAKCAREN